jgi:hypothetical protein
MSMTLTPLERLTTEGDRCLDDVARALVLACHEPGQIPLRELHLGFVLAAEDGGRFHNRRAGSQVWTDEASLDDCWGRALWGLGAAIACPEEITTRTEAYRAFERGSRHRTRSSRPMVFAALGAVEVLRVRPDNVSARSLLSDAARLIGMPSRNVAWPWPEPELTYANAALPEVLIAAGVVLNRGNHLADGLALLGWLVARTVADGQLPVELAPLEVATLAAACLRAHRATGDARWAGVVELAVAWFGAHDGQCSEALLARLSTQQLSLQPSR